MFRISWPLRWTLLVTMSGVGCTGAVSGGGDPAGADGTQNGDGANEGLDLEISDLLVSGFSPDGFDVSVFASGDQDNDASVIIHYCNASRNPGCTPELGPVSLTRDADLFTASVSGLTEAIWPGDSLSVAATAEDPDGVTGSPLTGIYTATYATDASFAGSLQIVSVSEIGFQARVEIAGDDNDNGSVILQYCNTTAEPDCDPSTQTVAMTRSGAAYLARIMDLVTPANAEGDQITVVAVGTDPDGWYGSPMQTTVTLERWNTFLQGSWRSGCVRSSTGAPTFIYAYSFTGSSCSITTYRYADTSCNPNLGGLQGTVACVFGLWETDEPGVYAVQIGNRSPETVFMSGEDLQLGSLQLNGPGSAPVDNLVVDSLSPASFEAAVRYSGPDISTAAVTLYVCNRTDSPTCNPRLATPIAMTAAVDTFTASVDRPADTDAGDRLRVIADVTFSVGNFLPYTMGHQTTWPQFGSVLSSFDLRVLPTQFQADLVFAGDDNDDASATIAYCLAPPSAPCDAAAGTTVAMTLQSGKTFSATVDEAGLDSQGANWLFYTADIADPDGAVGVPVNGSASTLRDETTLFDYDNDGLSGLPVSVAIAGDLALVGAQFDDEVANDAGAVFVYERTGATWAQVQKITQPIPETYANFGAQVALAQGRLLVAAPKADATSFNNGIVFIYEHDGSDWIEVPSKRMTAADTEIRRFGELMSASGDLLIVASHDLNSDRSVTVLRFDGASWVEEEVLMTLPNRTTGDRFFKSVAVRGEVAAYAVGPQYSGTREVRIRRYNGSGWPGESRLEDGTYGEIVLVDDGLLVGNEGVVEAYAFDGSTWSLGQTLTPANAEGFTSTALAVDNGHLLVGSGYDDNLAVQAGQVYHFALSEGQWAEVEKLIGSDAVIYHQVGRSVALSGTTALVGSREGNAYIFNID